jgi:hypothetical protein
MSRGRWYRGAHHQDGRRYTVTDLEAAVHAAAPHARIAHRMSLRRPAQKQVFLGDVLTSVKFYGIPPCGPQPATLTFAPADGNLTSIPVMPGHTADDAPTGPILEEVWDDGTWFEGYTERENRPRPPGISVPVGPGVHAEVELPDGTMHPLTPPVIIGGAGGSIFVPDTAGTYVEGGAGTSGITVTLRQLHRRAGG